MREVRIPAFAKINLRLEILGKRTDGYHELRTIFQTVSLHDELRLRASRHPGISLSIQGNALLSQEPSQKNLVYRAVDRLRHALKIRSGVEIELRKTIPAGRGLGGGSSDAAAALLGYLRLTGRTLPLTGCSKSPPRLAPTSLFSCLGAARWASAAATRFTLCPTFPSFPCSSFPRATFTSPRLDAYKWLKARPLTLTKCPADPKLWKFCALCWSAQGSGLSNDFERPVFRRHPRLAQIKRALLQTRSCRSLAGG